MVVVEVPAVRKIQGDVNINVAVEVKTTFINSTVTFKKTLEEPSSGPINYRVTYNTTEGTSRSTLVPD